MRSPQWFSLTQKCSSKLCRTLKEDYSSSCASCMYGYTYTMASSRYIYIDTLKKLWSSSSSCACCEQSSSGVSICTFVLVQQENRVREDAVRSIRQHTSAHVRIQYEMHLARLCLVKAGRVLLRRHAGERRGRHEVKRLLCCVLRHDCRRRNHSLEEPAVVMLVVAAAASVFVLVYEESK